MSEDKKYEDLPVISRHGVMYRNDRFAVTHVKATFREQVKDYYVIDHGARVGVVITRGAHILLVRQYRLLINGISWELPGGGVTEGESPQDAAIRECLEETGLICRELTPILRYHAGLDIMHNQIHLFHTTHFEAFAGQKPGDPLERVSTEWIDSADVLEMIRDGRIADCFTISGLLLYQSMGHAN